MTPKIVCEELWKDPGRPGLICVTTNSVVKDSDGSLAMGAGAAKQAAQRIPGIALEAGRLITVVRRMTGKQNYGFMVIRPPTADKCGFGIFQVKDHYKEAASLALITQSCRDLAAWCLSEPECQVRLNYPGIGLGKLTMDEVLPALEVLPQMCTICHR